MKPGLTEKGHQITLIPPDYAAAPSQAQSGKAPGNKVRPSQGEPPRRSVSRKSDRFEIIRIQSRYLPIDPEDRILRPSRIRKHRELLAARGYDLVHIQTPFVAHYTGLGLARRLGVPVVESYHTYFEQYLLLFVGYLNRDGALEDCYCAGDAFVFASRTETQGLVLLEAMALGVPVVSTAVMGTKEVLEDGRGCLIAADDGADFAAKAVRLLAEPALRAALGEKARDYPQSWSAPVLADRILAFYRAVTEAHGDTRSSVQNLLGSAHSAWRTLDRTDLKGGKNRERREQT